jgi:hypothetical protein
MVDVDEGECKRTSHIVPSGPNIIAVHFIISSFVGAAETPFGGSD